MRNINLNELTLDNLDQWPQPIKMALVLIVSILLMGLGYWLVIKSNVEQYEHLKEDEVTLRRDFEKKQHEASQLQAYRHQMVMMEERFGAMLKQLPTQNEMPGLLEELSKTGIASGLTFQYFTPMPETQHDFYIELPIKIAVIGNYHQIAIFLSRVAQMGRIVTLHDFMIGRSLSGDAGQQKDESGDRLMMEMTAKIYRYRTQ
jgi:type IV pilus assembly protein PilO